MSTTTQLEITIDVIRAGQALPVAILADYNPGQPAPFCTNPSANAYGDPGEDSEFFITSAVHAETGDPVKLTSEEETRAEAVGVYQYETARRNAFEEP